MVKEVKVKGVTYYQCEICEFYYKTREWAQKCEDFCNEHKACSVEITKYAVKLDEENNS